ncbi:unnamed protein product [Schistosoma turkestanicum]|nr:unnamed protein product [Schistosoma turkestanicum]
MLLVGWFVKSRRRHLQKLLTTYNRSWLLGQCYSRVENDDGLPQLFRTKDGHRAVKSISREPEISKRRDSVSKNLTDWASSCESLGYQQMESTNYNSVENRQQCDNNSDNNGWRQYYGNTRMKFLSSDV